MEQKTPRKPLLESEELLEQGRYHKEHGNPKTASFCFQRAAELGNPVGYRELGGLYLYGLGDFDHPKTAVEYFSKAALEGDALSYYHLAHCFEQGRGVTCDHARAIACFKAGAEAGSGDCAYALANCYRYGFCGAEVNLPLANAYLEQAADSGLPNACVELARLLRGKSVYERGDVERFLALLSKAMEKEFVPAYAELASAALDDHFVYLDEEEILRLVGLLPDEGEGYRLKGLCKWRGIGGEKDGEEAARLFSLAMEDEFCHRAPGNLATCLELGYGLSLVTKPSVEEEIQRLLELGSERGDFLCYARHGMNCLKKGEFQRAKEDFLAADEEGIRGMAYWLGVAFEKDPEDYDYPKAADYYAAAFYGGDDSRAGYRLGRMNYKGIGMFVNKAKAISLWKEAADDDYVPAMLALAKAYEEDEEVGVDIRLAKRYRDQADATGPYKAFELESDED